MTASLPEIVPGNNVLQSLLFLRDRFSVQLDYESILRTGYSRFVHEGDVVVDIGANEGMHTGALLRLVGPTGRLIAFEPIPAMAEILRNKFAAGYPNCEINELAISGDSGMTTFALAEGVPTESGIRQRKQSAATSFREITVRTEPLSHYISRLPRLDYVKVDVEGADIGAIRSGESDIRRLRPIISMEYGFAGYSVYGHEQRSLWDLAASLDYRLFTLFGQPLLELSGWMSVCDLVIWDWYLVPAEKADTFPKVVAGL